MFNEKREKSFEQIIIISILFLLGRYDEGSSPLTFKTKHGKDELEFNLGAYPLGVDIFMMLLGGFGYLMTFLKRYGLSAIGITMITTAILTEFSMVVMGMMKIDSQFVIHIGFIQIVEGGVVAAAFLISFGALIGKVKLKKKH